MDELEKDKNQLLKYFYQALYAKLNGYFATLPIILAGLIPLEATASERAIGALGELGELCPLPGVSFAIRGAAMAAQEAVAYHHHKQVVETATAFQVIKLL